MMKMNWVRLALLALLWVVASEEAFAQTSVSAGITTKNLGGGLRERTMSFWNIADLTASNGTVGGYATASEVGLSGVMATRVCGAAATSCDATATSSASSSKPEVGGIYPARKVWVAFDDWNSGSGASPSCSRVQLWGIDANGKPTYESFATINETGQKSKYAYTNVTRLYATGCTDVPAKSDLFAQATQDVAFGGDAPTTLNELVSICSQVSSVTNCLGRVQMKFFEGATPWLDTRAGAINLTTVDTDTDGESPVDLDLNTVNIPVTITWRIKDQ